MKLKDIKFYNVPYDENCRDVPQYMVLPDGWIAITPADIDGNIITPDRPDNIWVSFKCPINYNKIRNCNYLSFLYIPSLTENDPGTYKRYYAWIDSIVPESDDIEDYNSSTIINFHIDWWRTFIEKIKIKKGLILNRPPSTGEDARFNDPSQNIPCDYEYKTDFVYPLPGQTPGIAWIIISYIDGNKINKICYPVDTQNTTENINFYKPGTKNILTSPSLEETLNGKVIEGLEIVNEKVQGINISPIAPLDYKIDENKTLDFTWPTIVEYFTISNKDFIDHIENDKTLGRENIKYFANHNNELLSGATSGHRWVKIIYYENGEFKTIEYHNIHDDYKKLEDITSKWLNRNWFINRGYSEVGQQHIQAEQITEDMQYIPLIEYLKRYHPGDFYDIDNINLPEDNRGCFKHRNLWRCENKGTWSQHIPQNFTQAPNIKAIYNIGHNTYAKTNDGDIRVGDYDVWIKSKETTLAINKKNKWRTDIKELNKIGRCVLTAPDGLWPIIEKPIPEFASTDAATITLLDMRGLPIKKFSKKLLFDFVSCETITTGNSSSILIRFKNDYAAANNLEITLPCTPIETTEKYLHEYITSGQRETDQQNLTLSVQQSLISSMSNMGLNTFFKFLDKNPLNKIGIFSDITRNFLSSGLQQLFGEQNIQAREDALKRRGSFLIRQCDDYSWIRNGSPVCLTILLPDTKNAFDYGNIVKEYGINVKEYREDIELKEGPIKIVDTLIIGDVPLEARNYIKNKLAEGVYINSELTRPINKIYKSV